MAQTEPATADETQNAAPLERGNWTGKLDFLLSLLGYAIGLGSIWRFPYLCFENGGGAFLIPYFLMLLIIGIPCFFLEISIGQYAGIGPTTLFNKICPIFKGLGVANFYVSIMVALYYNMIVAWTIYYTFASFTSDLPWGECGQDFNSENCFSISDYKNCTQWRESKNYTGDLIYLRGKCINDPHELDFIWQNLTHYYGCTLKINNTDKPGFTEKPGIFINVTQCVDASSNNISELFDIPKEKRSTSAQEYFERNVLNQSDGIHNMGKVEWHLALCLLAAWILTFLCLFKGIKTSGKVVYFTTIFPIIILIILLIKALTLPGAELGIHFYIVPDYSKLTNIKVWKTAAVQIFFSLSVAGGGLTTLSSYNKFNNSIIRDTMIVCFGTSIFAVIAGFCIFSVLGFMAHELGVDVQEVVKSGFGLAFIAYPDLVTRLPAPPVWAFLFFMMLFCLGLDSEFAIVEIVLTGLLDWFPKLRPHKTAVIGVICIIGFLLGLPLATGGGGYLLVLIDDYATGWPFLFIGLCELILISYIYGIKNFLNDIREMIGWNPSNWVRIPFSFTFLIVSPVALTVILFLSWIDYEPLKNDNYIYPNWANGIGWAIAMFPILFITSVSVLLIFRKLFFEHKKVVPFTARVKLTFSELTKSKPEWRENALRALSKAAADEEQVKTNDTTEIPNGSSKGHDNLAFNLTSEEPSGSYLKTLFKSYKFNNSEK